MHFKKTLCLSIFLSIAICTIQAAPNNSQSNNVNQQQRNSQANSQAEQRDRIMLKDNIDETDIYAIPLDSSEVEDEEEVNRLEGKQVFDIGR